MSNVKPTSSGKPAKKTKVALHRCWLLKIPQEIHERWSNQTEGAVLGQIKVSAGVKPGEQKLELKWNQEAEAYNMLTRVEKPYQGAQAATPGADNQLKSLIFNGTPVNAVALDSGAVERGVHNLFGYVERTVDVRPRLTTRYQRNVKQKMQASIKEKHGIKIKEQKMAARGGRQYMASKYVREVTKKRELRVKAPRDEVRGLIFLAFQTRAYLPFSHLLKVTRQPEKYLKQMVREVCDYHNSGEFARSFSLKPEYVISGDATSSSSAQKQPPQ
jgi:transcription initiation factor TFIIF subunit beta